MLQAPVSHSEAAPTSVAPAWLASFAPVPTAHLSDNLQRMSGMVGLQRYHGRKKLLGTACTVKVRPGDNLFIYKALTELAAGQVLVIDGGAEVTQALVGELIMLQAIRRQCAGFVIDGAIRDSAAFAAADFPCYARAVSHRGPYKLGPGAVGVPVAIGGQVVMPGDVIVGDEDGVVSFPQSAAPGLLDAVARTAAKEEAIRAEIAGAGARPAWLDQVLSTHGL